MPRLSKVGWERHTEIGNLCCIPSPEGNFLGFRPRFGTKTSDLKGMGEITTETVRNVLFERAEASLYTHCFWY